MSDLMGVDLRTLLRMTFHAVGLMLSLVCMGAAAFNLLGTFVATTVELRASAAQAAMAFILCAVAISYFTSRP